MSTTETSPIRDYCESLPKPEGPLFPEPREGGDPLLHELILSMLVWNATPTQAAAAMGRIAESVVDENELRVCFADDITDLLGPRYPRLEERAERLLRVLNAVYAEEHGMTLEGLRDTSKREARVYLDTLDGIPPFVAARVFLLGLGGHAFPIDERITQLLIEDEIIEAEADAPGTMARFERAFRAGEAGPMYRRLEAALNGKTARSAPTRRKRSAPSSPKTKRSAAKP
ncbi:MAG: hypothetical protein AAGI53_08945 [Planctomycetota bacterium]